MTKEKLGLIEENLQLRRQEIEGMLKEVSEETTPELSKRLKTLNAEYLILQEQVEMLRCNATLLEELKTANRTTASPAQYEPVVRQPLQTPAHNVQRRNPMPAPRPKQTKRDLEKTLGKNVMGVMASILIFIALIMFAVVALPTMTDTIKIISMFILSGGMMAIGALLMNKDSKNVFNASIAGCGIGAVFISLMTTRMYFNAIGDYSLYVLLLIWAAAVAFFSKDKHKVFVAIAEIGISAATFIGAAGLTTDSTGADIKASMLVAFALLSEVAIYYFNSNRNIKDDLIMHIPHAGRALILTIIFLAFQENEYITSLPLIMILFIGAGVFAIDKSEGKTSKSVFLSVYLLNIILLINNYAQKICNNNLDVLPYVLFISMAIILHIYAIAYNEHKVVVGFSHFAIIVCSAYFIEEVAASALSSMAFILPSALVLLPVAIFTTYYKTNYWKWLMAILPFFYVSGWCNTMTFTNTELLFSLAIGLIYTAFNFYTSNETKDDILRICLYVASLIFFPFTLQTIISEWQSESAVVEAITSNIHMLGFYIPAVAAYIWVDKSNTLTKEKDITVLQNVMMALLIVIGAIMLHDTPYMWVFEADSAERVIAETSNTIQSWITGIVLLALNALRTKKMLINKPGYGIGLSAAYLITFTAIITKMSDVNYIVSISLLLLSIAFIVLGFKIQIEDVTGNKEMRIFGLILSMIVVIKLLMLDIEHNTMLEASGCLLLAGVLCFAISFAYNRLDKARQLN